MIYYVQNLYFFKLEKVLKIDKGVTLPVNL